MPKQQISELSVEKLSAYHKASQKSQKEHEAKIKDRKSGYDPHHFKAVSRAAGQAKATGKSIGYANVPASGVEKKGGKKQEIKKPSFLSRLASKFKKKTVKEETNMINEQAREIVRAIVQDDGATLKESIQQTLAQRAMDAIESRKVQAAKQFFGQVAEGALNEISDKAKERYRRVATTDKDILKADKAYTKNKKMHKSIDDRMARRDKGLARLKRMSEEPLDEAKSKKKGRLEGWPFNGPNPNAKKPPTADQRRKVRKISHSKYHQSWRPDRDDLK